MIYLIKFVVCSGVLLLFYHLVLQNDRLFKFNRFYLLAIVGLSLIIPVTIVKTNYVEVPALSETVYPAYNFQEPFPYSSPKEFTVQEGETPSFTLTNILWSVYTFFALFFLLRFFRNLWTVYKLKQGSYIVEQHGIKIVLRSDISTSFSFLNYMFTNKERFEQGQLPLEIVQHEKLHIIDRHSIDIILIELFQCMLWFNPFIYFINKAIKLNHEFLADAFVIKRITSAHDYQRILLDFTEKQMLKTPVFASNLNYGFTKKRLNMMTKNTNKFKSMVKQVAAVCIIACTFWGLGVTQTVARIIEAPEHLEAIENSRNVNQNEIESKPERQSITQQKSGKATRDDLDLQHSNDSIQFYKITGFRPNKTSVVRFKNEQGELIEKVYKDLSPAEEDRFEHPDAEGEFLLPPPEKKAISQSQFDEFLDAKTYGLWIDHKKVKNDVLKNYSRYDIHHFTKSRLYGRAKAGKDYSFQVNITTNTNFTKSNHDKGVWIPFRLKTAIPGFQDFETPLPQPFKLGLVRLKGADGKMIIKQYNDLSKEEKKRFSNIIPANPEYFLPPPPPKEITQSILDDFTNAKKYGVWLDNKRISNKDLNNYKPDDFHHFVKTKLGKKAGHYGQYEYQIELHTLEAFNPKGEWKTLRKSQTREVKEPEDHEPEKEPTEAKEKRGLKEVKESNEKDIKPELIEVTPGTEKKDRSKIQTQNEKDKFKDGLVTQKLMDEIAQNKRYWLSIDGQFVKNNTLENYSPEDFYDYFKAGISGESEHAVTYDYEIDLVTMNTFNKEKALLRQNMRSLADNKLILNASSEGMNFHLINKNAGFRLVRFIDHGGMIVEGRLTSFERKQQQRFYWHESLGQTFVSYSELTIPAMDEIKKLVTEKYIVRIDGQVVNPKILDQFNQNSFHHALQYQLYNPENGEQQTKEIDLITTGNPQIKKSTEGLWMSLRE